MGDAIKFSVEDLKTTAGLERTLRQIVAAMPSGAQQLALPDPQTLARLLAPYLRDLLQSPGSFPLNLTALLPSTASGAPIEDTHANRASLYTPPGSVGLLYWETDRTVLYIAINSGGSLVWRYVGGRYVSTFANRPSDLVTDDTGFLFFATDQNSVYIWTGAAWDTITRRILFNGGFFSIFDATLSATRTYTFPDATGNITYETAALTNNNFLFGGGGALVKDAGFASPMPIANGGTGSATGFTYGSWTPAVTFGGGSTGLTYALQQGTYEMITTSAGSWVRAIGTFQLSNKGSSTGAAVIGGLPFTVQNVANQLVAVTVFANNLTGLTGGLQTYAPNNETNIYPWDLAAGTAVQLDDTFFANNTIMLVAINYKVS